MKTIKLSNGRDVIVDDNWYEYLSQFRWFPIGAGYASRQVMKHGVTKTIYMHRQIAGTPEGMDTDHINGDKLDNRESNLRVVDHATNLRGHLKLDKRNTSGHRGVSKNGKRWRARAGRGVELGSYNTIEEAVKVVEAYRRQHA